MLATQQPTLDTNISIRMIDALAAEIGEAFGDAHERLVEDETALRVVDS